MNKMMKSVLCLLVCALMIAGLAACGSNTVDQGKSSSAPKASSQAAPASVASTASSAAPAGAGTSADQLKVALVLNGSITDASWNANGYNAVADVQSRLGFEFAYIENVDTADMEATFRDYADQGYDLVLGHGSQFEDPIMAVASSYPDTKFFVFNGEIGQEPNVGSYRTATDENTFVAGALAALVSKSGKIGWIGAVEVPTTSEALDGYAAGAKYANPEIEVSSAYVGSYDDVAKAKELALTMFESGVDVIQSNANQGTAGIIEAAKEYGNDVMLIGNTVDQYELAPDLFLTSNLTGFAPIYEMVIQNVIDGKFEAYSRVVGLAEGALDIAPYHNFEDKIPEDVKARVEEIKQEVMSGELNDVLPASYPGRE